MDAGKGLPFAVFSHVQEFAARRPAKGFTASRQLAGFAVLVADLALLFLGIEKPGQRTEEERAAVPHREEGKEANEQPRPRTGWSHQEVVNSHFHPVPKKNQFPSAIRVIYPLLTGRSVRTQ